MKSKVIFFLLFIMLVFVYCGRKEESEKDRLAKLKYKAIEDTRKEASAPKETEAGYNFSIYAPKAKYVSLVGDFNNWLDNRTPMEKNKYGVWSVTIPLKKGIYSYKINIDGTWIIDAKNPEVAKDNMGDRRSIIEVTRDTEAYQEVIYLGRTNASVPKVYKKGILFSYKDKFAKKVSIAGSFNNWEKEQFFLRKNKHGVWECYVQIPKGKYYYKYNVDGLWKNDPVNPHVEDDSQGDHKSVLIVERDIEDRPNEPIVINYHIICFQFYNEDLPSKYNISVIGDFNNWQTNINIMSDNDFNKVWFTTIRLKEGDYYYKFYLAGKEFFDPENKVHKETPEGKEANYLKVIQPEGKRNVKFTYSDLKAKNIFLVGDFNNWNPEVDQLTKDQSGLWYIVKKLYAGKYMYQYIIDDEWTLDPFNSEAKADLNGNLNSFIEIK